ncbi:hypothetical protein K7X08_023139 [Anisodus acutangulus]|uniref:SMAX1-like AAA+ ATPase lid domain-containing protein n=1 Tax=Anisodus acutangulus TaxID=402998 RepID=A0A9Q1LEP9_9SOLA|nr:hypothetical protein K7X08_023139 [Anisodus acutangulus]
MASVQAKDDKMVLGTKIAGLQRKWDNLCQRLHYNQPLPKTRNFRMSSEIPSVVGFQVVEDQKKSINNEETSSQNASSTETRRKNMTSTISSSNERNTFLSKFSETPSQCDDEHGFNSPTSVTSVTTYLGLCMASTSPSKEQEKLTNQSSLNQAHNISCNVSASAKVLNQYDMTFRGKHVVDYVADKLRYNPLSVVFLEKLDKADLLIQKSLSQAVKIGRFLDSHGREKQLNTEEDILAAKGWQIQILIAFDLADDVKSPNSSALITTRKRSSSQIFVNNRKLTTGPIESVDQQCGSLEIAKRAHRTSNTCLDLNLLAEEIENYDNFTGDSGCDLANENTTAWLKQLFTQFDETAIFTPFDFDSLAEKFLKEIRLCFHKIVSPECLLQIDTKVLEQILTAACLSNSQKIEDWIQHVLSRGFVEAQEKYSLSARSIMKLVTCERCFLEVHLPGVLLPCRIIVN